VEGFSDGLGLGTKLGKSEGIIDGSSERLGCADLDGAKVGVLLGCSVGSFDTVGVVLGLSLGRRDGLELEVGLEEGLDVGWIEGVSDGWIEGVSVGESLVVGLRVGSTTLPSVKVKVIVSFDLLMSKI
jgi:hypothetical protein